MNLRCEVELTAEDHPLVDGHDVSTLSNMVEGSSTTTRQDLLAEVVIEVLEMPVFGQSGILPLDIRFQNVD